MRKKIKELMNREEGFTLVELLAVIVILGIIIAIAIPSVSGIISNAQENANEAEQSLAVEAARMYVIAEDVSITSVDPIHNVTVATLVQLGYFESKDDDGVVGGSVDITLVPGDKTNAAVPDVDTYSYLYKPAT